MLVDIVNAQVNTENVAVAIINDVVNVNLLHRIDNRCIVRCLMRKKGSRNIMPWVMLNIFLLRFRPDIIHFHLEGMRKMVLYPVPCVFTIHNVHTSAKEYSMFEALYAISEGVREYTRKQGFEAITVWNGVNTGLIQQKESGLYKAGEKCRIINVGRLYTPHKGQDILVQALAVLKQQGKSNFHLDLIGDGESRGALEEQIKRECLGENVSLLGQKDKLYIYEHLRDYDLFVLPSRSEGFGLSVAEAMCANVPVVVCDLAGVMDVIAGGRLGMSFRTGDVNSLADQISLFMNNGANEVVTKEARLYATKHFDVRQTALRYVDEYKKVLM